MLLSVVAKETRRDETGLPIRLSLFRRRESPAEAIGMRQGIKCEGWM